MHEWLNDSRYRDPNDRAKFIVSLPEPEPSTTQQRIAKLRLTMQQAQDELDALDAGVGT